jgi:hypothetical protein
MSGNLEMEAVRVEKVRRVTILSVLRPRLPRLRLVQHLVAASDDPLVDAIHFGPRVHVESDMGKPTPES